ncbi:Dabb family protein [Diaminobutyricibacter sp. McL0608]|uniref:Dabb family protein n=1 Tax=Leifsonia sp. McL0608 TaxID=3143537 RepID=UPI0031F2F19A
MIRHVVTWKLAATDDTERAEQVATIAGGLRSLPPHIPEILSFEVGENVLHPGANFDLVLIAEYEDADALARYQEHPEHKKVASYIRTVVADRSAVDFEV